MQKICPDLPRGAARKAMWKTCHCSQNPLIPRHNQVRGEKLTARQGRIMLV